MLKPLFLFTFNSTFTFCLLTFSPVARADATTCPDMNGHFQHKQFAVTADAYITQTACTSMQVLLDADILGSKYTENVQSPMDGVTRSVPSQSADETDTISGKWAGDSAVFIVDRYVTDSGGKVTHTTSQVKCTLTTPTNLQGEYSDVSAQGTLSNTKDYDFTKIQ